MTKIITWCELRFHTLDDFWLCPGRFRSNSDAPRPARPSAPLCSPALKASTAPSRRASPGSRSRERERLGLAPSRRVPKPS